MLAPLAESVLWFSTFYADFRLENNDINPKGLWVLI